MLPILGCGELIGSDSLAACACGSSGSYAFSSPDGLDPTSLLSSIKWYQETANKAKILNNTSPQNSLEYCKEFEKRIKLKRKLILKFCIKLHEVNKPLGILYTFIPEPVKYSWTLFFSPSQGFHLLLNCRKRFTIHMCKRP